MATNVETLGSIHRQYNEALKEAIAGNVTLDSEFKPSDNDTENFMKIDIANHRRDVGYILSVLKCGDSAYVSRALKRCAWLMTEPQHAHVINSHHLRQHLFPHMTTKNYIKLIKHIKLTLKDETRAEEFYLSETDPKVAITWLPLCSASFMENNIERHLGTDADRETGKLGDIKIRTFKRLCEKSDKLFEIVMRETEDYGNNHYLQAVTFLLHTNVDVYLDILERVNNPERLKLSDVATGIIMKHCPKRVFDKFEKYIGCIHVPTFAKHLKREHVKIFLYEQAEKIQAHDSVTMSSLYPVYLHHLIQRLPKDEQFKFVKDVFIDMVYKEVPIQELFNENTEANGIMKLCNGINCNHFSWYKYATFEIANEAYVKEITEDPDLFDKYSLLSVLLECADHNLQHTRTVLQHFLEVKETTKVKKTRWGTTKICTSNRLKINFFDNFLSSTPIKDYDEITWKIIIQILTDMDVYEENGTNYQQYVQTIIIYSILHDITIPDVIQKKFAFSTLKSYKTTMNQEQNEKIFSYLYEYLLSLLKEPIVDEEQFAKYVKTVEIVLQLFIDWEKELVDYPFILNIINEFVTIRKEHSWETDLSSLYNKNKKWRRHLFSASLSMCTNESTCLNVLKHEPRLLARHSAELHELRTTNPALHHLLAKLRIYWPNTIAEEWIDEYMKILNEVGATKLLIRGLCTLLPRERLMNTIKENAPEKAKIDWYEVDERTISLRRFIASNMHVGRPQPTPDTVLLYAKGDYLKFAHTSLLAIFYNSSPSLFKAYIPKVLDAPVSLQKHGLRFVYRRCAVEEVKETFLNTWQTSKNVSIRAVIFSFTYTLLCNEEDNTKVTEFWKLIETLIDSLTFEEDKKIYELLFDVEKVPFVVRGKYLMKSYKFLLNFLPNAQSVHVDYKMRTDCLAEYSRNIMELLSSDFITDLINRFVDEKYLKENCGPSNGMIKVISAYLLGAKDELTQMQRYENVLVPIMQHSLNTLNENFGPKKVIRDNFLSVLECLMSDLEHYVVQNNMIVPTKMFVAIQTELNKLTHIERNYLLVTKWKLLVELTKLVEKVYSTDNDWYAISEKIGPEFGKKCVDYLKEDIKLHFPCIYLLFAKSFREILRLLDDQNVILDQFVSDVEFTEGYLLIIQTLHQEISYHRTKYENVRNLLYNHPSVEIQFHCHNRIPSLYL